MRAIVFLLVALNLVFFAWTQGFIGVQTTPDAVRLNEQLAADQIKVLSRDEPPEARTEEVKKPVPERCLAWLVPAEADAERLEAALGESFGGLRRVRRVLPEQSSWWVLIPPQANKAEADKKAAELKRLGIKDFFVVQEAGANRLAISLGVFSSEQAAEERLEDLRGQGVRSAKVARRAVLRAEQVLLEATGPETRVSEAKDAMSQQFPDMKTAACGNS